MSGRGEQDKGTGSPNKPGMNDGLEKSAITRVVMGGEGDGCWHGKAPKSIRKMLSQGLKLSIGSN